MVDDTMEDSVARTKIAINPSYAKDVASDSAAVRCTAIILPV